MKIEVYSAQKVLQKKLNEKEFHKELKDIISVGLQRYKDKYIQNNNQDVPLFYMRSIQEEMLVF